MVDKKKKEYSWSIYPKEIPKLEYEMKVLPLQNEIGKIRQAVCKEYSKYEGNWKTIKGNSLKKYHNVKEWLHYCGISKDSTLVLGGSVGGATLLGYLIARKKGMFKRVFYPLVGGALVGSAFYVSYDHNRQWLNGQLVEWKGKLLSLLKK